MFHQPEIRPFGNDSNYEPWFLSMHHVVFHHLGCTHGVGILLNKTSWICLGWMPEFDTQVRYPMYQGFGDGTKPKLGNICHSDFIQLVTYPLPNRQFAGWWFKSTWTSQPFETTMQCSIICLCWQYPKSCDLRHLSCLFIFHFHSTGISIFCWWILLDSYIRIPSSHALQKHGVNLLIFGFHIGKNNRGMGL